MRRVLTASAGLMFSYAATSAVAQDVLGSYTLYGTPGLVETPTADTRRDAEIGLTLGGFENQQRLSFNFQVTPRFSGTFRYSRIADYGGPGRDLYDRSFDLHYQIWDEREARPALAIGLRDFLGTGRYSGEYLVATTHLSPSFRVSTGLGWGRLATEGGFDNPLQALDDGFAIRPPRDVGRGGRPAFDQYFRGEAAFFGGVEWGINDKLVAKLEYSSDGYEDETRRGLVDRKTPLNFGLTYAPRPEFGFSAYVLGGTEIGFSGTLSLNPTNRAASSGFESAPDPVFVRSDVENHAASWQHTPDGVQANRHETADALSDEGITLRSMDVSERQVRVSFENERYRAEAQALGRVARVLTRTMPPSVETFVLEPARAGLPLSSVALSRSSLENLENRADAAALILQQATITEATQSSAAAETSRAAATFEWGVAPFVAAQVFDGSKPLRGDYGIQGDIRYEIRRNLIFQGTARYRLGGNREGARVSDATLPPVRRNVGEYGKVGSIGIEDLALHWYERPGRTLYSRVSAGYLEPMFAGISTELLWKPVDSRLALGGEVNYVTQRDYGMGFGAQKKFADRDGSYEAATGHLSAYYDFENGFHGQIDVGRYLAGDWGTTVSLDREFANGWRVGAYATFTDVPFDDFGEGSFDKGIRLKIPIDWALGNATRDKTEVSLSSLSRDGGARINVDGRLYGLVRDGHSPVLGESWGRFWR